MLKKSPQVLEDAPPDLRSSLLRAEKREDTRSKIALYYVVGYLALVLFALILFWARRLVVNDLRDMLLALSGILSGPLGFIIGYYFKSHSEKE
ncbi:MAG: hypothetical protein G01um101429_1164 [Parcubacteria group bacterium Gr01-1014_29]|nr:MAG: hypothetical protein G01um101429_1164 [Parcubacteria group bacterium Gr01-1014_29]